MTRPRPTLVYTTAPLIGEQEKEPESMETIALRELIARTVMQYPGATLWPNGLGFDRYGWTYTYMERIGRWSASKRMPYAVKHGEGGTPKEAREAAVARTED